MDPNQQFPGNQPDQQPPQAPAPPAPAAPQSFLGNQPESPTSAPEPVAPQPFQQPDPSTQFAAPATAPDMSQTSGTPQENPGQVLGIVSIVLALFFPLVGLILGFVSRSKSKAAGASPKLGTIGIIVNAVLMVLSLLVFILFFVIGFAAVSQEAANSSTSQGSFGESSLQTSEEPTLDEQAAIVSEQAEAYKAQAGDYPKRVSAFEDYPESTLPDTFYVNGSLYTNTSVTYIYCAANAAQVLYLGATEEDKIITPLGTASATESCR